MPSVDAKPLFKEKSVVQLYLSLSGAIVASLRSGDIGKLEHFFQERLVEDSDRTGLIRFLNRLEAILNNGLGRVEHTPAGNVLFELPLDYKVSKVKDKWKVVKIIRPLGAKPFKRGAKLGEQPVLVTSKDHKVNLKLSGESDAATTIYPDVVRTFEQPLADSVKSLGSFLDSGRHKPLPECLEPMQEIQESFKDFCFYDFAHLCKSVTTQMSFTYRPGTGNVIRKQLTATYTLTAEGTGGNLIKLLISHLPAAISWLGKQDKVKEKYPKLLPALHVIKDILELVKPNT